jgi:2-deoxy-D-gluconate 3-dehydrogenase
MSTAVYSWDEVIVDLFNLKGRRALVVGAAGDLGLAALEGLLEAGAAAVAIDIDPRVAEAAARLADRGHDVAALEVDVRDREAIRKSVATAMTRLGGPIDILVNAAGIQRRADSIEFSESDWDEVLAVNLTATFLYCQLAARSMLQTGRGKIINIASIMSHFGGITIPAYAASKGGVAQLTKAFSNDLAGRGICVNAIAPGYFDTKLNTALIGDARRSAEVMLRTPIQRWGLPADIKGTTIFLASAASDFVTGAVIPLDGGYSAR